MVTKNYAETFGAMFTSLTFILGVMFKWLRTDLSHQAPLLMNRSGISGHKHRSYRALYAVFWRILGV